MTGLVLSLFPGIGLLDAAFEEIGFCVVRGPDLLWGGDVRKFHPPAGRFDGVIGGPPCQAFSRLRHLVAHTGLAIKPNLIPEFCRCVSEADPEWFVMENVLEAPVPDVHGYDVHRQTVRDVWCGGETMRSRAICYGTKTGAKLRIDYPALHRPDPEPAALASGSSWDRKRGRPAGTKTVATFVKHLRLQGLPADFDLPPFTVAAKVMAVGNGVPLAMGRAIARAVVANLVSDDRKAA